LIYDEFRAKLKEIKINMKITKILPSPYPDIDELVERLSVVSKNKFYKIVKALLDEANLTDSNTIGIPFPKLSESNLSDEDLIAIFKSLYKNNIATTLLTIREFRGDKEKPGIGLCESILENKKIFYNKKTEINIKERRLKYLHQQLERNTAKTSKQKVLLEIFLDENKKVLVVKTTEGTEIIGFKKKKINERNKNFDIKNTKFLDDIENDASETNLYKVFATYYEKKKVIIRSSQKEVLSEDAIPNSILSKMLDISTNSIRSYQKRIRKIFKENDLPIELKTDNKGNYQLFVKTKNSGTN